MISNLKLSNFRLFDDEVEIRFRPITVLIGRNNAGKSSIIKFLLMLQQSLESSSSEFLRSEGGRVKMGDFRSLKNSVGNKDFLNFELTTAPLDVSSHIEHALQTIENIKTKTEKTDDEARQSREITKKSYEAIFQMKASVPYNAALKGTQSVRATSSSEFQFEKEMSIKRSSSLLVFSELEETLKDKTFSKFYNQILERSVTDSLNIFRDMFQAYYLHALRDNIMNIEHLPAVRMAFRRVIELAPPPRGFVGEYGVFAIPHLIGINKDGDDKTKDLLFRHLKGIADVASIKIPPGGNDDYGILLQLRAVNSKTQAESYLAEFGFGVSQVTPILVQGVIQDPQTQLMVEQPESQLHPTAQLELGSFFADIWNERKVGSIIETHSDNILLRLRRLIAKGELNHNDVSIAYFDIQENKPIIKNLDIQADGSMQEGLPIEFFHSNIEEALNMGAGK